MTIQTKQFIELSDIAALKFECKSCHAILSVAVPGEVKTPSLRACPHCDVPWAALPEGGNIEAQIKGVADSLRKLQEALKWREEREGGFSFALEIRADATAAATEKDKQRLG